MKVVAMLLTTVIVLVLVSLAGSQEADDVTSPGAQNWYIQVLARKEEERKAGKMKGEE